MNCIPVDVGGEDFDIVGDVHLLHSLASQDSQGVGFLARGAARHPEANFPVGVLEDFWQLKLRQVIEGVLIAEKAGNADQQFTIQRHDLAGVIQEKGDVILDVVNLVDSHAALDAPSHGTGLVQGEIDLALLP